MSERQRGGRIESGVTRYYSLRCRYYKTARRRSRVSGTCRPRLYTVGAELEYTGFFFVLSLHNSSQSFDYIACLSP